MPRLAENDIARRLRELPAWQLSGNEIVRTARLATFKEAVNLVVGIADLAEAMDHHPDIDIRYRMIRLALSTHDEGGLTERDFDLAQQIEHAIAIKQWA
jgi:4a-hydroxytetrahydrobiopterin dehydratase